MILTATRLGGVKSNQIESNQIVKRIKSNRTKSNQIKFIIMGVIWIWSDSLVYNWLNLVQISSIDNAWCQNEFHEHAWRRVRFQGIFLHGVGVAWNCLALHWDGLWWNDLRWHELNLIKISWNLNHAIELHWVRFDSIRFNSIPFTTIVFKLDSLQFLPMRLSSVQCPSTGRYFHRTEFARFSPTQVRRIPSDSTQLRSAQLSSIQVNSTQFNSIPCDSHINSCQVSSSPPDSILPGSIQSHAKSSFQF